MKDQLRDFWNNHPCGSIYSDAEPGSRMYYLQIAQVRYTQWDYLSEVCEFRKYRGKEVLEVGCGLGVDGTQFAFGGAAYSACDQSEVSLGLAKRHFDFFGLSGNFHLADAEQLPFADASYDLVYSHGVLHHTPDTFKAIAEVYRVLRPGGKAIIMLYRGGPWSFLTWNGWRWRWKLKGQPKAVAIAASTDGLGNPLSKLYGRRSLWVLFNSFPHVQFLIRYFPRRKVPLVGRFLPSWIDRLFGGYWYIKAVK